MPKNTTAYGTATQCYAFLLSESVNNEQQLTMRCSQGDIILRKIFSHELYVVLN